jgi:hypothetical protein
MSGKFVDRWFIRYEYGDGRVVQVPESGGEGGARAVALLGGLFVALGAGVGAALALRMSSSSSSSSSSSLSPAHAHVDASALLLRGGGAALAAKALLCGTALALAGTAGAVLVTARLMHVSSFKEFGDRMRQRVPEATQSIGPEYVQPLRRFLEKWMKKDVAEKQ